jgi:hypothetical protein
LRAGIVPAPVTIDLINTLILSDPVPIVAIAIVAAVTGPHRVVRMKC